MRAGDQVIAKHKNGRYYVCKLRSVDEQLFCEVDFDDGSFSNDLLPEDIKVVCVRARVCVCVCVCTYSPAAAVLLGLGKCGCEHTAFSTDQWLYGLCVCVCVCVCASLGVHACCVCMNPEVWINTRVWHSLKPSYPVGGNTNREAQIV